MTDWIDRAQEVEERAREVSVRSVQRLAKVLDQPRLSLSCEGCGDPVEAERLAACPGATRCIDCQERHERFVRTHVR